MIIHDLDYITGISLEISAYKIGGQEFSSSANSLAIAQTRTGDLPIKEEYSLTFIAVATGHDYASSQARSEAKIVN